MAFARRLLAIALAGVGGAAANADDSERLAALLSGLTSFQANFEQAVVNALGETVQTSTGTLHWLRPLRMRWETNAPYPQLVLADGQSLWVFDADLAQVSVRPLAASLDGTPAVLLADDATALGDHFKVRAAAGPEASEPDAADQGGDGGANAQRLTFTLVPVDDASVFRTLTFTFTASEVLAAIDTVDHLGQRTRTTFHDARRNLPLAAELFTFKVPEGVDVIGEVPSDQAAEAPRTP